MRTKLTSLSLVAFALSANPRADAVLSFDVRAVALNGAPLSDPKNVAVSLGDLVTFDLFAIVTGAEGNMGLEGFSSMSTGSMFSSAGGKIRGDFVSPQNVAPFNATASSPGRIQDLDGDGDLDLGSNKTDTMFAIREWDFIGLRSGFYGIFGNAIGLSEFRIFTTDFEVTDVLDAFSPSDIEVQFRYTDVTGLTVEALWREDDVSKSTRTPDFSIGESVHLSHANLAEAPEPSSALLLVGGAIGLGAFPRRAIARRS